MNEQRPLSGGAPIGPDGGTAFGTGGRTPSRPGDASGATRGGDDALAAAPPGGDDTLAEAVPGGDDALAEAVPGGDEALAEAVLGEGDPAEVVTADVAAVDGVAVPGDGGLRRDEARDLAALAEELGACAAVVPGVAQVRPRPGFAALAQQVVEGVRRWSDLRTVVGGGAPATPPAPAASAPVVGLAVSDAEVRITLDVAVADGHAGPAVARAVVAELLAHPALADLPEPWVDLRIVSIG